MFELTNILITAIVTLLSGGGIGFIVYWRQNRKLKELEVQKASVDVKADDWKMWREQCQELQELNKTLINRNHELVKHNAEKQDTYESDISEIEGRFKEQTDVLRKANRDNAELYKRIAELEREKGDLQAQLVYAQTWVCKKADCDHGDPPRERLRGQKYKSVKLIRNEKTDTD